MNQATGQTESGKKQYNFINGKIMEIQYDGKLKTYNLSEGVSTDAGLPHPKNVMVGTMVVA